MTVFGWIFMIGSLAAAIWLWSFMFRGETQTFRCAGCGKCVAAGECVFMKEERERKLALEKKRAMKKNAASGPDNPRDLSCQISEKRYHVVVHQQNAVKKSAWRNRPKREGRPVQAPCPCRHAAALEQSAASGTAHPRYRMT